MNVYEIHTKELSNAQSDKYLNSDLVKIFVDATQEDKIYYGLYLAHQLVRNSINVWYIIDLNAIPIEYVVNLTNGLPFSHVFLKFDQLNDDIYKLFKIWSTHQYMLVAYVPFDCIVKYDQQSFDAWRSFNNHSEILYNSLKHTLRLPSALSMSPVCYKLHKS